MLRRRPGITLRRARGGVYDEFAAAAEDEEDDDDWELSGDLAAKFAALAGGDEPS